MLFSLTHDVLQSERALENAFHHLRPGGQIAGFGAKWASGWRVPVNLYVWLVARRYVTTFAGFGQPWDRLSRFVPKLHVEELALGGAYVAWGRFPPA